MNKPSVIQAAWVSAVLSLLFLVVYGGCNWLTSQRSDVGIWYYQWERYIPFVPLMIVPYMSIDLFYVAAPFVCQSREELRTFARRVTLAIVLAGACFLLIPLRIAVPRPEPAGWTGAIFNLLHGYDHPYNLFPSLHIAFRTILVSLYTRHTKGLLRGASHVWFSLIGFSTLLTYQHHIVDVAGGFLLAAIVFYVVREGSDPQSINPNYKIASRYTAGAFGALLLSIAGWPWTSILLWPAASLALIAAAYAGVGPGMYRKTNGCLPLSARLLLAPCLLGQWISLVYYRRQCDAWSHVTPRVWIGGCLGNREARQLQRRGVTAVLDLTAEFSEPPSLRALIYRNIPILDLTAPSTPQLRDAAAFIADHSTNGIVYVHCKIGYSRTAAVVGAYLLQAGLVGTPVDAAELLRKKRRSLVIRPEAWIALKEFGQSLVHSAGPWVAETPNDLTIFLRAP